jgi:hypothetical protein
MTILTCSKAASCCFRWSTCSASCPTSSREPELLGPSHERCSTLMEDSMAAECGMRSRAR